jgi:hypothetical protein
LPRLVSFGSAGSLARSLTTAVARAGRGLAPAPWLIAVPLAAAWLVVNPPSADLAGAIYRTQLFDHVGFTIWDNQWYGGVYTLSYSVLFPPLAALLGPRLLGALAAVAAAWLFARLAEAHFGRGGRLGAWWFSAAAVTMLMSGRLVFALGVAVGLAALAIARSDRPVAAGILAAACSLSSPVAGAFLALAGVAWIPTGGNRRALALLLGAALPLAAVALAFPEGGTEPFGPGSFSVVLLLSAMALVVIRLRERPLAVGVALYALVATALYLVPTPIGGNVIRLGALFGGPLLACTIGSWRDVMGWRHWFALAVVAVPFGWWQWSRPILDVAHSWNDPTANISYFAPLLRFLDRHAQPIGRIEVVPLVHPWQATYVAPHYPLARGWEKQLDTKFASLDYGGRLTASTYRGWLDRLAVRYVALPDYAVGSEFVPERRWIERGLPYLRPVFRSTHWRVFAVRHPHPLAQGAARIAALGPDYFVLRSRRPGETLVRVRYSPYWALGSNGGCVEPAHGDWTRVLLRKAGEARVTISFSLGRVIDGGQRCNQ